MTEKQQSQTNEDKTIQNKEKWTALDMLDYGCSAFAGRLSNIYSSFPALPQLCCERAW